LQSVTCASDIEKAAKHLEAGSMGDTREWQQAEDRWRTHGIDLSDLQHMTGDRWPIGSDIAEKGFPFLATTFMGVVAPEIANASRELIGSLSHLDIPDRKSTRLNSSH